MIICHLAAKSSGGSRETGGIKQSTSSPGFAQSNGQTEHFIQTIKRMMKKADDIYLALLEYRNTPITGTSFLPAQIVMSRTPRSKIPVTKQLLKPAIVDPRAQLMQQKLKQRVYHDRSARSLGNPTDVGNHAQLLIFGRY